MRVLFLSTHLLHEAHLGFAHRINAKIKIIPFDRLNAIIKKYQFLCVFYPLLSLIYSLFIKVESDVLVVDGGSALYVAAFLRMRNKKLKLVYIDAEGLFYDMVRFEKSPSFSLKLSLKMIDGVITVSEKNKAYISKFLDDVPIELCPPYPKEVTEQDIARKNYGLYLGRLGPEKNIKRIIDFAIQCPYFERFIIVGDGMLKGYIEERCKKDKKLIYLGRKEDISKYYSECKFFIHIPDVEAYGCTVLEAAICGCYPIISSGVGTGYLFDKIFIVDDPNDFGAINKRIGYILDNEPEVKRLLKEAAAKMPTKEQSLELFENKFRKIIKWKTLKSR